MLCNECLLDSICKKPCTNYYLSPNADIQVFVSTDIRILRLMAYHTFGRRCFYKYKKLWVDVCNSEITFYKSPIVKKIKHRKNGPAVIYSDLSEEWWLHGRQHRLHGPALTYCPDKDFGEREEYKEWWVNGTFINETEIK